ncbi:hypothetical protein FOZ60_001807 [Perkinsus olseni]|uniref:Uncharacterized protein n=1 Tax=Perkinsus olseni TaxID=32597 RepID=A0A7J6NZN3_PEROL|nr:hypothetical protein FOZ60_001807 [Perkinsus olseni]
MRAQPTCVYQRDSYPWSARKRYSVSKGGQVVFLPVSNCFCVSAATHVNMRQFLFPLADASLAMAPVLYVMLYRKSFRLVWRNLA